MGWLDATIAAGKQSLRLAQQAGAEAVTPFMSGGPSAGDIKNELIAQKYRAAHPGTPLTALSTFASKLPKGGSPVFAEMIPAGLSGLYDLAASKVGLPESGGYFKDMQHRVDVASQKGNELLHTDAPHDAADVAARMAGGMLLPGPKIAPLAKAAGIGTKAARVGAEVLLPGRQGGLGTVLGAVGVGVGANEGIDALAQRHGGTGIPGYNSVADITTGGPIQDQQIQGHPQHTYADYIQGDDKAIYDAALAVHDDDTTALMEADAQQQADEANVHSYKMPAPDWEDPTIKGAILAVGAVAALTHSGLKAKALANISADPASLMGEVRKTTNLDTVDKLVTDHIQADQPLRAVNRKIAANIKEADLNNAKLDQVSAPAFNSRIHHGVTTGEFGRGVSAEPTVHVAQDYASLGPDEQQAISEGLLAKRAYGEFQRNGVAVHFKDLGNVVPDDPTTFNIVKYKTELSNRIRALRDNPKLSAVSDRVLKQYNSMLDLDVKSGVSNADKALALKLARPDYVPIRKNNVTNPGDDILGGAKVGTPPTNVQLGLMKASTEEGGGVAMGEAANPVHMMFDEWTKRLHNADVNETRRDIIDRAIDSGLFADEIKKLPPGHSSNSSVSIFRDGKEESYHLTDSKLQQAFDLNPFAARGAISTLLGTNRKMMQWAITGPGSITTGYFAPKAAAMDAYLGAILRPNGSQSGMINELWNKLQKPGASDNAFTGALKDVLSRVDPTGDNAVGILTKVPIGFIRGIHDDVVEQFANSVDQAYRSDSYLKSILGEDQLQALAMRSKQAFENTTKSRMMQTGAYGSSMFGSGGNPSSLTAGVKQVAPDFASSMADANVKNAMASGAGPIAKLLARSESAAMRAYANPLGKLIANTVKSINSNIHESARYMHFAANEGKMLGKETLKDNLGKPFTRQYINDEDAATLIASQTRRLAGDVGQVGQAKLTQELNNAIAYANIGVQSMAQGGRMFMKQPVSTMFNTAYVTSSIAAAYLASLYLDPGHRNRVAAMTPEQRVSYVPLPNGMGFNVPQEIRPVVATVLAHLDEITGMNNLDENGIPQFNEDFGRGVLNWMDNGLSEENQFEQEQMQAAALKSLNPYSLSGIPALGVAQSVQGIDPQKTALTGQASAIKTQQVSGQDPDTELTGDFMSAQTQKVISALVNSTIAGWLRPALDAHRALDKGVSSEDVEKVVLSRLKDNALKSQTNLAGQLWGQDYDRALPKSTLESELYYKKQDGIKKIEALSPDIRNPTTTSLNPKTALPSMADIPPNLQGTQAAQIFYTTHVLQSQIRPLTEHIAAVNKQMEQIDNQYGTTIENRNKAKNEKLGERQVYQQRIMNIIKTYEGMIRKQINDPTFTYHGSDIKKYTTIPSVPASSVGSVPAVASENAPLQ